MSKIVVIDDEEDMLEDIKAFLSLRGYSVLTAANAQEGLKLILDTQPDVAILDIRMPGMSGLEILRLAKESQPKLISIILTGQQQEVAESKSRALGASLYLTKPIGLEELERAVDKVLQKGKV